MDNIAVEVIYLLIFGVIVLYQYLMRRREQEAEARQPPPPEPLAEETEPDPFRWEVPEAREAPAPVRAPVALPAARAPADEELRWRARPAVAPVVRHQRSVFDRNKLFRSKSALRDAIVTMTILGPCRALETPRDTRAQQFAAPEVSGPTARS